MLEQSSSAIVLSEQLRTTASNEPCELNPRLLEKQLSESDTSFLQKTHGQTNASTEQHTESCLDRADSTATLVPRETETSTGGQAKDADGAASVRDPSGNDWQSDIISITAGSPTKMAFRSEAQFKQICGLRRKTETWTCELPSNNGSRRGSLSHHYFKVYGVSAKTVTIAFVIVEICMVAAQIFYRVNYMGKYKDFGPMFQNATNIFACFGPVYNGTRLQLTTSTKVLAASTSTFHPNNYSRLDNAFGISQLIVNGFQLISCGFLLGGLNSKRKHHIREVVLYICVTLATVAFLIAHAAVTLLEWCVTTYSLIYAAVSIVYVGFYGLFAAFAGRLYKSSRQAILQAQYQTW